MTRLEKAIEMRDALVAWLPARGEPYMIGNIRCVGATLGRFRISYRTPFSGTLPQLIPANFLQAQLLQKRGPVNLAYGLDVWDGKKVMNIEWDGRGRIDLVGFRAGEWETEIVKLCEKRSRA
jgi:hypothetical protein